MIPETRTSGDRPALRRTNPLVERRFVVTGLETRAGEDDGPKVLVGYAAKFDKPSNLRYFTEVIRAGAFSVAIDEGDDVRALFNHDVNLVLGRTKSGTLTLREDAVGLKVEITLPDTQLARDLCTSIERGDVDQMSFAFVVIEERWTEEVSEDAEGRSVRTVLRELLSVRLYDVSPVTFPAYDDTEIGVRDLEAFVEARCASGDLSDDSRAALDALLAGAGISAPAGRSIDTLERELRQASA
ncbi:hypothetical protein B1759_15000 [Rubrivirga sp. SAORIC476]|uniref:HK97 family phage prohead protease n=1 Tax=Rubrivirga sp. SAORIC476 TaxID=1961794 RepID=UPI000BD3803C|nr:HK97 family phage prohead protease [Rubrivirga sp. SAORIC476]PAP79625.1 hypothetical protein B1759_15000 [Rubrivirga sp. SAORIC476]